MCDPILVTLLKMQPHYSQSSRENATPSSGTSPVASYKEVPPPPGFKLRRMVKGTQVEDISPANEAEGQNTQKICRKLLENGCDSKTPTVRD